MATVTPAVSVSFFRSEFNDFLYASLGAERNEMPLSVLSALARLNVDPWEEAAELSELPRDTAARRLASLLGRLPGGRWAQADLKSIAGRLIELLPRAGRTKLPLVEKARGLPELSGAAVAKMLVLAALGITALIMAASYESSRSDRGDAPGSSTSSVPQTSAPSSR